MTPAISVTVPVYNVEPYLRRCIDSILAQTFMDFELVFVDDGSPDSSGAICEEYSARDERITVIHKPNGGISTTRNTGLDYAFACSDSEWLSFIDSDDWVHERYLEALKNGAAETGLPVVIGAFERTYGDDPTVDVNNLKCEVLDTASFFIEHSMNAVVSWGKLYKKDSFTGIRYPIMKRHEDESVSYKVLFQNEHIAFCSEPLYAYYRNDKGLMSSTQSIIEFEGVYAYLNRIGYFEEKHNEKMLKYSIDIFCESAVSVLIKADRLSISKKDRNQLKKRVKKIIRPVIIKYGRRYYPLIDDYIVCYSYSIAFPIYTKSKLLSAALIKKLQRLVKK